jgi:hypothetical protein
VAATAEEEEDLDAEDLVAEVGNLLNFAVGSTIGAIGGACAPISDPNRQGEAGSGG